MYDFCAYCDSTYLKGEKSMKKWFLLVTTIVILLSFYACNPVNAYVSYVNFIGPLYKGYDAFYGGDYIVAYEVGSDAALAVAVYNEHYDYPVNISAVKVRFDWGIDYTSTEATEDSPIQIEPYQTRVFTITFSIPTNVSNLVRHPGTIYVEHVDRLTGTPKNIVGTWTYTISNFVAYSTDQADAQNLYQQLMNIGVLTYSPSANFPYLPIISSEARMLWTQARTEANTGSILYTQGDFTNAKTYYQTAYNMANQSLTIEAEKGASLEDTITGLLDSLSQGSGMQSEAFLILSIGISIGVIMIGVGVVLYGLAKRKIARMPPPSERQP